MMICRINPLLERIIRKGGLMGTCARSYSDNAEKAEQFILECYNQCHNAAAIQLWGEELVIDIQNYIRTKKRRE